MIRKNIITLGAALLATGPARADKVDDALANRETMIGAVALLTTLPPNCAFDHKPPDGSMIARFILSYGHKGDDDFLAQVQATHKKQDEINKLPEPDRSKALKFMCDLGIIYSKKVRDRQSYPK